MDDGTERGSVQESERERVGGLNVSKRKKRSDPMESSVS